MFVIYIGELHSGNNCYNPVSFDFYVDLKSEAHCFFKRYPATNAALQAEGVRILFGKNSLVATDNFSHIAFLHDMLLTRDLCCLQAWSALVAVRAWRARTGNTASPASTRSTPQRASCSTRPGSSDVSSQSDLPGTV